MNLSKKWSIFVQKQKHGVFIDIKSPQLLQDVEFILYNLPKTLIKGIEIIEEVYDVEAEPHQIIVNHAMNVIDIKKQIGKYVFREKRWKEQEEITKTILATEKIDVAMFREIYNTNDYLKIYEVVNQDVFAVCYGHTDMTMDEIVLAINSLYIKEFTDRENLKNNNLDDFVNQLFQN
ncbi:hypothetical protein [Bacillus bombysepticus]|uniref:hypothetical protein n=1 Tax=Bacillus bombysepticus TaxID=658666 RepID=UPI003019F4FE